jgi:hypothetical protein
MTAVFFTFKICGFNHQNVGNWVTFGWIGWCWIFQAIGEGPVKMDSCVYVLVTLIGDLSCQAENSLNVVGWHRFAIIFPSREPCAMKGVLGCWDVGIWNKQFWNRFETLRLSLVWSNLFVDSAHPIADHQRSWQLRDALQVGRWAEIGASHSEPKWRIGVQTMWYSGGFQALTNVRTSFHEFSAFYPLQSSCKVSSHEHHKRLQSSSLPKWICCATGLNFLVPPHNINR